LPKICWVTSSKTRNTEAFIELEFVNPFKKINYKISVYMMLKQTGTLRTANCI